MWSNWSGGQFCVPAEHVRPGSRAEVAAAVVSGRAVRVAGSGHSFSGGVPTDGTLLSLDRLDRVLDADPATGLVRVEAGIPLARLSRELDARGLAMPNLGDVDVQSLAGAISTGTHGTGARLGNLSTAVAGLELVLADGSERELTEADDLLRAARVGLGALGVVVAVTLRCVPAFRLHAVDAPQTLEDVLADLDAHVDGNDHFELFAFPHSPLALTRTNNRTDHPADPRHPAREWLQDVLRDNHAFALLNRAARRVPRAIPRINRLAGRSASRRERVRRSFEVFASPRLVRFEEMEYAVPRDRAAEAVRAVREVLARHPVSFPIELRFAAADDALLSTAHGRDSAYVAVHVFQGMDFEPAFREVEALMGQWGGRPHWGKRSFLGAAELAPRYPRWDAFAAIRDELDPGGRFVNSWIARVLGITGLEPGASRRAEVYRRGP
jgi:FAD-linked oxidoreductase